MLRLPRTLADAIRRHAERDYPEESCGVLLGRTEGDTRVVVETRACTNARAGEGTYDRYAIAPRELIAAQREARERGLAIIGFYHSHPDHPAQPSATDIAEAHWPACVYVIVSVDAGSSKELAAYLLKGEEEERRFATESIAIV